jgi:hypothetical protein
MIQLNLASANGDNEVGNLLGLGKGIAPCDG